MDLSGLEGLGYYLAFFALICNALASTLAIWGANKATPSAEEQRYVAPPPPPSRLLRFRDSLVADEVLADELAQRQCTRVNSGTSRDLSAVEEEGEEEAKKEYPILQKVIDWGTSPESRAPIPVSLLEAAFEEVDEDATGTITKEEFASALQACGFNPSLAAMDRIMLEIDRDNSGEIDIHEFVRFFKMTEELVAFAGLSENRKTLQGACCSMCFCMNLIAWAVIGVLQTPGSEMASMWQGLTAALVVLFIYNVGLPMVRLTLGPSIAAWWEIVNFHIQRIKNRRRAQAAKRETERQEALELERRAAAWEAGIADSQGSSPKSPRSPHSPGVTQSSWTSPGPREAGQGAEVAALTDVSGSEHSPKALMPPGSPLSRCSPWGTSTWSQEEEEEGGDTPGVYLVLHEGTSVRTGVSIHSPVKRLLKRGAQVRIAEVFHYKRQGRLRGRLENLGTGAGGGWITIKDPADDYRWAQRTGPLQRNPAWGRGGSLRRTRRPSELGSPSGSISRGHTSVLSPGASSRGTFRSTRSSGRPSQGAGRRSKVSDAESLGAPPYEPDAYDEAWARAEAWAPETTFIGTSQVRDVRLYLGQREELPEHRFVPGGAAFSRGEWRGRPPCSRPCAGARLLSGGERFASERL